MELRQLEFFCAVSTLENFTKAAHFLHVSQPSVTKTIQALETELNLKLFDRRQKHFSLTEAGKIFLLHAKKILQDVQTAQQSIEKFQSQTSEVIRFGVPPMFEAYLFPEFFIKFQANNPKIILDLQECQNSEIVLEKINADELDFGIIFSDSEKIFDNAIKILEDEIFLCLSHSHKLANAEKISFAQLKHENFILQPVGTFQNFLTLQKATDAGFAPKILLTTSQIQTIKKLVASGSAISLLPNFTIKNSPELKKIPLTPPIKISVALSWNKFKELSAVEKKFLKFLDKE